MKDLRRQCGFTLTEMLVAIAVLMILMGALLTFGKRLKHQARENLCRSTIELLVAAVEQYYDFHNAFPSPVANAALSPIENLYAQLCSLPNSRALCQQIQNVLIGDTDKNGAMEVLDPWQKPFDYQYVPGWTFPKIVSAGPDKQPGTGDDISSK